MLTKVLWLYEFKKDGHSDTQWAKQYKSILIKNELTLFAAWLRLPAISQVVPVSRVSGITVADLCKHSAHCPDGRGRNLILEQTQSIHNRKAQSLLETRVI